MVKFKLAGSKQSAWPLKVKKNIDVDRLVDGKVVRVKETITEKIHLRGDTEYNTEDSKFEGMSIEDIEVTLKERIVWNDKKEEKKDGENQ